ncbi:MAG: hypothetical protein K6E71_05505 [Lachnospiraceae bacterium]|nr:hypothetical protein [Lachnospiraceae bacterium]
MLFDDELEANFENLNDTDDVEEAQEILGQFLADLSAQSAESIEKEERDAKCREGAESMRTAIAAGNYDEAYANAETLRRNGYGPFQEEVEQCVRICADHDIEPAVIHVAERYMTRGDGRVLPEAFPYLKKLAEAGYIRSFRWIADCYHHGIGCEKDDNKAAKYYLEAVLFGENELSKRTLQCMRPELKDYQGDDLGKKLVRCLTFGDTKQERSARTKLAEMILDGHFGEYAAESAYGLLKRSFKYLSLDDDGIAAYRLGECLLRGVGTTANPVAASFVLDEATFQLQYEDTENAEEEEDDSMSLYTLRDYKKALSNVEELQRQAERMLEEIAESQGSAPDDELILEEWENESLPTHIKRSPVETPGLQHQ